MASSLRLPAGSIISSTRFNLMIPQSSGPIWQQCRSFSQSSQRWAYKSQNWSPRTAPSPSARSQRQDALQSNLPNDVGLLPGTFVRPLWRDLPSIFKSPRDRWRMEWTSLKNFFQNYGSLIVYCKRQMNLPLLLRERRKIAKDLHSQMYTALAHGDVSTLRTICCNGLREKLIAQIEGRPPGEKVTWKLIKWLRRPSTFFTGLRIVAERATMIPEFPKSGIRQIVVRMTSRQSMQKSTTTKAGKVVEAPAKVQDCEEYIVIQQLIWNNKPTEWQIWGHTNPTTLEKLNTDPFLAPGLSLMERLEAMKNMR